MYKLSTKKWSVERMVFLVAGLFVTVSVLLGLFWNSYALYFTVFVGLMLVQFSLSGWCPSAIFLHKACKLSSLSDNEEKI